MQYICVLEVAFTFTSEKQDLSEFQRNSVSKVMISYKTKKYEKQKSDISIIHNLQGDDKLKHAKEQLMIAIKRNDIDMIEYWKATINNLNKIKLTDIYSQSENYNDLEKKAKQIEDMDYETKNKFILLKMNEAKALNDKDAFNYWNANMILLNQNINDTSKHGIHK